MPSGEPGPAQKHAPGEQLGSMRVPGANLWRPSVRWHGAKSNCCSVAVHPVQLDVHGQGRTWPEFGRTKRTLGQHRSGRGENKLERGRLWSKFGGHQSKFGSSSGQVGPKSANICRFRPTLLAELGPSLVKVGPKNAGNPPFPSEFGTELVEFGPGLVNEAQSAQGICQDMSYSAQNWSSSAGVGRSRPNSAELGPALAEIGRPNLVV